MPLPENCPVCLRSGVRPTMPFDRAVVIVDCPTCAHFEVGYPDGMDELRALRPERRYILSGVLREATAQGQGLVSLVPDNIPPLSSEARLPATTGERLERIGRLIDARTPRLGRPAMIMPEDEYPVGFAHDPAEFGAMLRLMVERGLITTEPRTGSSPVEVTLTTNGIAWLDKIRLARPTEGDRVFVAMRFSDEMNAHWEPGFRAGCAAAGYQAVRIDKHPHNDVWLDRVMALIRECRFVVADLSDRAANSGVGFEAGFAKGLGLDVIFTCNDAKWTEADAEGAEAMKGVGPLVHANFKQFTVIRWKNADDLRDQLKDRILGTIGRYSGPPRAA